MDKVKKEQVLEILDYWKTIEFIGQTDIPYETTENKKLIKKIRDGQKVDETKVEVFTDLQTPYIDVEKQLEDERDKFTAFPSVGENISFCFGRIERNEIVDYLKKYIKKKDENPEIAYPKRSTVAWFSFKTDVEGLYIENSFQLSPLLWAISEWEKSKAAKKQDFYLKTEIYDQIIEQVNSKLTDQKIGQFAEDLYTKISKEYVDKFFPNLKQESMGFSVYFRYVNEEEHDKDDDPVDYADLGKSFFLNDIVLLKEAISSGTFGDKSEYEKKVIEYILSAYEKSKNADRPGRIIISPKESIYGMIRFFELALNVNKAPIGKWPAKFMPALMQQVAVNLAIDEDGHTPIFSVNGPPGTGKTTLLKEIVASNIVERARLLSQYSDPDEAFEKRSFKQGPLETNGNAYYQFAPNYYAIKNDKINNYGMLVASCNNAAVENITIDLPKGKDILESLEASDSEELDVKAGLDEVRDLFDIEKSDDIETINMYGKSRQEQDIYFTRYANKLFGTEDCWGLVSAPFGKKSNIRKYCTAVLKPFVEEYKKNDNRELHRQKFKKQKELFLSQLAVVEKLQNELEEICQIASSIPSGVDIANASSEIQTFDIEIADLQAKIKLEQKEIMELEESRPRCLFGRKRVLETRDVLIKEHKDNVAKLNKEKAGLEESRKTLENVEGYLKLLQKYSVGKKKMTPIDDAFMNTYISVDEKTSTKAQVTNPWFTAEYNREREKLFLYACKLHKEFVISSKAMRHNIINLMIAWNMFDDCSIRMKSADREDAMPVMLQSIFLMTPVISTTFASAQTFLGEIGRSGTLGTLIVDESGQAQPQMSVGAMFRCRKSIIVGDPKQIEPVVTTETDMIKQLLTSELLSSYKDKTISVQGFADFINPYGTYLGENEEREWVGCPLVVHRRCIDPMYSISNVLSYDNTMKQQTAMPEKEKCDTFILEKSCWIDVTGSENSGTKDHFVKAQGEVVLKLLEKKFEKDPEKIPKIFIITPFTSVKIGMIETIRKSALYRQEPRVKMWLDDNNIGTVHTFQGQGTDEVIFLLGCDKKSVGAANWVNKNIVNVAATRAKFRFYIIGDKMVWTCKPVSVARNCIGEIIKANDLLDELCNETGAVNSVLPSNTAYVEESEKSTTELIKEKVEALVTNSKSDMICPNCGKPLVQRNGRFGKFYGCSGFPSCKYTKNA